MWNLIVSLWNFLLSALFIDVYKHSMKCHTHSVELIMRTLYNYSFCLSHSEFDVLIYSKTKSLQCFSTYFGIYRYKISLLFKCTQTLLQLWYFVRDGWLDHLLRVRARQWLNYVQLTMKICFEVLQVWCEKLIDIDLLAGATHK